jgi:hypothetical protein
MGMGMLHILAEAEASVEKKERCFSERNEPTNELDGMGREGMNIDHCITNTRTGKGRREDERRCINISVQLQYE